MRAIVVEDNPTELEYLKKLLLKNNVEVIGEATNGYDAFKFIKNKNPDVAFLDISMPGLSGIEVAKLVSNETITVFVTGDHQYALDAYNIGSIDYILKPITSERINETLKRISRQIPQRNKKLSLNIKGVITLVDIDKIYCIEKKPIIKKLNIFTDKSLYTVNGTLNEYYNKLKEYGFYRAHTSFIVNTNKISQLIPWGDKSYIIKLKDIQKEVLLSRKFAPGLKSLTQL